MSEAAQLTFQTAFDLFQKQSSSLDQLWNFYATVAVALLTAVVASDKLKATRTGMYVIVGGFVFFAVSNAIVVVNTQRTLIQLAVLTNKFAAAANPPILVSLTSSPWWAVLFFHVIADVAFILAMWLIYRSSHKGSDAKLVGRRRRSTRAGRRSFPTSGNTAASR